MKGRAVLAAAALLLGVEAATPSGAEAQARVAVMSLGPWAEPADPVALASGPTDVAALDRVAPASDRAKPIAGRRGPLSVGGARPVTSFVDLTRPAALPTTLSAVLPGSGQLALGQRRGWIYLAVEAVAWAGYVDRRAAAASYRDRYRDFAWERARSYEGPRHEAAFSYYEHMAHWDRSGRFDRDPDTPGLQPETDPGSYNGVVWDRARRLFLGDGPSDDPTAPGWRAAADYYEEHAYDDRFRWDWSGDQEARSRYGSLIEESDVRARQATIVLGVVLANHLLSAVDGFLAARGVAARVITSDGERGPGAPGSGGWAGLGDGGRSGVPLAWGLRVDWSVR